MISFLSLNPSKRLSAISRKLFYKFPFSERFAFFNDQIADLEGRYGCIVRK
jgi:hypothetical protein